jgi:penicillin-binding protein 2
MLTPGAFEDRRSSQGRLGVIRAVAMGCFGFLAVAFWVLQVIGNARYTEMADINHLRTIPLRAPRGVFFDRNGKVLVENRSAYSIAIIRERVENSSNPSARAAYQAALAAAIRRLAGVVGVDEPRLSDIVKSHLRDPIFRPIAVVDHATDAQVAAVMARRLELPEVVVQEVPVRDYPAGGMAAHMFGYVSEITQSQLGADVTGLQSGAMVGKTGLEKVYNAGLMGRDGKRDVIVNSQSREVGELGTEDPRAGQRMQLTIDYDLQRALEDAYRASDFAGAAVFLDPRTGEVLALTSQPEYDPNDFADGINSATWARLMADPKKPLTNRLIQNRYPPGSTFKILIATAALAEGIITPDTKFTCYGKERFYGQDFHCDKKEGHGTLDLRHAIEQSCNVYFFHVGDMLKIDTINEYAQKLGLTGKTGIDLPEEVDSLVPSSAWKLKKYGEKWYPAETISVTIGQGYVDQTPMSLAVMMAAVANGGTVVTPHIVKAVDEGQGWQPMAAPAPRSVFPIRPDVLGPVVDGLWMVVNGDRGTGSKARIAGHDVVGKTGTAQVISDEGKRKAIAAGKGENLGDDSWFVFFAPKDNPQIAGAVFVEHGGHGGNTSAPIVRHVLDTYFAKQEGRALPTLPVAVKVAPAATGGRDR